METGDARAYLEGLIRGATDYAHILLPSVLAVYAPGTCGPVKTHEQPAAQLTPRLDRTHRLAFRAARNALLTTELGVRQLRKEIERLPKELMSTSGTQFIAAQELLPATA